MRRQLTDGWSSLQVYRHAEPKRRSRLHFAVEPLMGEAHALARRQLRPTYSQVRATVGAGGSNLPENTTAASEADQRSASMVGRRARGGGGNRTRVLQYLTRASPCAVCCAFLSPGSHADKLPTGSVTV